MNEERAILKVATYRRVSSEEQVDGYSLDAQRDAMRDYSKSKGWEIITEYEDGGYSGSNDNRPGFINMMSAANAGLFDVILVHKLDRFSRNREHAVVYKSQLRKKGIRVVSVSEPLDDSPSSLITEAVLEAYNEYFLINLRSEIRKGKYQGARNGDYQGGALKFGYTLQDDKGKHKIVVDSKETGIVTTIYNKYNSGMTLSQLTRWLNDQGVPTKNKGRWFVQKLSKILKDRTYIGEGTYGEVIMPFPPIIPTDLFDRVQARLSSKKHSGRPANRVYLLSHLGRCGECGASLLHETQRRWRYIYCYNQSTYPEHQCFKPKRWNLDNIENHIWGEVEWLLNNYKDSTYDLLLDRYESAKADREQQIAKGKADIERCKRERQTVLRQVRKGNITQAEADIEFTIINKEQKELEQELNSLLALETEADVLFDNFMTRIKAVDKAYDYGFHATPQQKKEILNMLLDKFILYRDGKIELRFKVPVNDEQVADKIQELSLGTLVS